MVEFSTIASEPAGHRISPNLTRQAAKLSPAYTDRKFCFSDSAWLAIARVLWRLFNTDNTLRNAKQQVWLAIMPIFTVRDNPEILQLPRQTLHRSKFWFLAWHNGFRFSMNCPSLDT